MRADDRILEPYGIAVSVVCPTFFRTNPARSLRGHDSDSRRAAMTRQARSVAANHPDPAP